MMGQGPWYSSNPTSALEATATARTALSSPLHTHRPRHREPCTPLEPTRAKFKDIPCPQGLVATGGGRGICQPIGHLLIVPTSPFPTLPEQGSAETNLVPRMALIPSPENHSSSPEAQATKVPPTLAGEGGAGASGCLRNQCPASVFVPVLSLLCTS